MKVPERYRWWNPGPDLESTTADGNNGVFRVPQKKGPTLRCIVSDGGGWQHVSVSLPTRCPTWDEMCYIKGLFWNADESVVQYHPAESEYVNCHPYCLHLWRCDHGIFPMPPSIMVGIK